jgi:SH3-like domain-containing protein
VTFRGLLITVLASALSFSLFAGASPAAAQMTTDTQTTLRFKDVAFDAVAVEVRTGPTEDTSVPYGSRILKKGETWEVSSNLPIYWRRELNPGSNDGRFTPWQRVFSSDYTNVDIAQ